MNRIRRHKQDRSYRFYPLHLCKLKVCFWLLTLAFRLVSTCAQAEEFSFDVAEFEKKPYHLGGYAEVRPVLFGLGRDAALYRLRFYDRDEGQTTPEYNGKLQIEGSLEKGIGRAFVRINSDYQNSYRGETFRTTFYDGYFSLKPSPSLTLEAGKKSLRWGTGYAWNPVAFFDRPKDPDDPELNLEGFILTSVSWIKSFDGPLRTLSLTPVLLPVYDEINDDFGEPDHLNAGGRLYALLYDTDIDLLFLAGGSRPNRYGFDFARNLTSNFEVHGEFAYLRNVRKRVIDAEGVITEKESDTQSYLVGIRYLSEAETTWIAEYYHNGAGYSRDVVRDFFKFVNRGYDEFVATGDASLLRQAENLGQGAYTGMNPMRDYLYLRASQKEPFDILYLTPAVTTIFNLIDRSFSLSPEILYTAVTNLELRLKGTVLQGERGSEYGEKQNDWRLEIRLRYYF
ncbi:MAG: hypothetical protein IH613_02370 [Desulfuromonadales bacterium]|nr:hypothetical protein [Desulfuromonadales bacterium]